MGTIERIMAEREERRSAERKKLEVLGIESGGDLVERLVTGWNENNAKANVRDLLGVLAISFRASEGEEYSLIPRALLPVIGQAIADKKGWSAIGAETKSQEARRKRRPYLKHAKEIAERHPTWKRSAIASQLCKAYPDLKYNTVRRWDELKNLT
jgi:hypothetical protein